MASISENQMNLKTLQRVDSTIVEIIDNACQVAIYKYERKLKKWEETDVEGSLFLYRRSSQPKYGFIIMNRMSTTNFVESITSEMQFQLQEPYLLYKNQSGDIIGSWFYEHKDLQRIAKRIQTIVLKPKSRASENDDILTLLCEAQQEYIKKEVSSLPFCKNVNNLKTSKENKIFEKSVKNQRYMSTGSFDSHILEATQNILSPNNSSHDQTCLQDIPSGVEEEGSISLEPSDWQNVISGNCNFHLASIKEAVRSNVEVNPKFMPKIHEAYVSSLKTYFT